MGIGEHAAEFEVAEAATEEVVLAARRWRFLLLVLLALVDDELALVDDEVGFGDEVEAAVELIFATAVAATGEPVIDVVVSTALGLCAAIWERIDAMAESVF